MSDGIKVDYAEIDRLTTGITALNAFAGPLVPKVGALSVDGDLLASAILSPGTALAAEGAVMNASAQLSVTIVSTEALVIITASISKVYEAAEVALLDAVHAAEEAIGADNFWQAVVRWTVLAVDTADATRKLSDVLERALVEAVAGTAVDIVRRLGEGENPADVVALLPVLLQKHGVDGLQDGLKAIPGAGYQGLLDTIIRDGSWLGWFDDRPLAMTSKEPALPEKLVDGQLEPDSVQDRADAAYQRSLKALGLDDDLLATDDLGRIKPNDLASLFAGSSQIDAIGGQDVSDIRVIKTEYADGKYAYTVQIPSTLRWWPETAKIGNDFTSDAIALQQERQTALADAAWKALDDVMGDDSKGSPVMLTGFSLGGITAGSMAADPRGHNVQQVVTAGAPIGRFEIPPSTNVTAFEADGDPVARLDGVENPRGTISGLPARLDQGAESGDRILGPVEIHNADRYARMAQQSPVNSSEDYANFFDGKQEVFDAYGTRE